MARVSVIIPARQEPFLRATVVDALAQARGDVEVIAVLDGWWPQPALPTDARLKILHWGTAQGLRPSINAAVQVATGDHLFKLDAHCALAEGYDVTLAAACLDGEVVVPEKYSLVPETWTRAKAPWRYFYLTWPWEPGLACVGLQDRNYPSSWVPTTYVQPDDILSYQGSAWMLRRTWWDRLLPHGMDAAHYYFAQEPQEVGLATYLAGGRCRIETRTWYAHLWKGQGAHKRQFIRHREKWHAAMAWSARHWMAQPGFAPLIQRFGPLPGWPTDWEREAAIRWATPTN